jgi:cell division protein FtsB
MDDNVVGKFEAMAEREFKELEQENERLRAEIARLIENEN